MGCCWSTDENVVLSSYNPMAVTSREVGETVETTYQLPVYRKKRNFNG